MSGQMLMPLEVTALDTTARRLAENSERNGLITANRLKAKAPHAYALILERTRAGHSLRSIVKEFREHGHGVHESTVQAVRETEFTPEQLRQLLGRSFSAGAAAAAEIATSSLVEAADLVADLEDPEVRAKSTIQLASAAAVASGIMNQNAQLLTGGATHRVEEITVELDHDQFQRIRQEAAARADDLSRRLATARDITPEAESTPPA